MFVDTVPVYIDMIRYVQKGNSGTHYSYTMQVDMLYTCLICIHCICEDLYAKIAWGDNHSFFTDSKVEELWNFLDDRMTEWTSLGGLAKQTYKPLLFAAPEEVYDYLT